MPEIPAWCPHCHAIFGSGYHFKSAKGLVLGNNTVPCRACRRNGARLMDGEFNIQDGIIDAVRASDWTRAKLAEFQAALQWAADNFEQQPTEAIQRIEEHSPEVAKSVRGLGGYVTKRQIAMALAGAAIWVAGSVGDNVVDRVMDDVWPRDDPPSTSQPINPVECPEPPSAPHQPPSSGSSEPQPPEEQNDPNPEPPETQSPP